ncbi:MAG TPA: hypothetical protein DHW49_14655 [Anaerolineae bacterium]|nr:hypothetical protein [Anaerolineae bacterium]
MLRWLSEARPISTGIVSLYIQKIAKASFGIYLIHIIVLEVLDRRNPWISINIDIGNPIWSIPFVTILVFLICFFIVNAMQKTKILKKIIP